MKNDHIVAPAIIEAADDAEALRKASELLTTSQFLGMEVWHGFLIPRHLTNTSQRMTALHLKAVCQTSTSYEGR